MCKYCDSIGEKVPLSDSSNLMIEIIRNVMMVYKADSSGTPYPVDRVVDMKNCPFCSEKLYSEIVLGKRTKLW